MNDFFEAFGDSRIHLMSRHETPEEITLEDVYQRFKARMLAEMAEAARDREIRRMDIRMKVRRLTSS